MNDLDTYVYRYTADLSVCDALTFAIKAHGTQVRKYTGEPYWTHPVEVAGYVASVSDNPLLVQIALLHDTIEDTDVTYNDIRDHFGSEVADGVQMLTDDETGNRAARKAAAIVRLSAAPSGIQTVKLADNISNGRSILRYDPNFAIVYCRELQKLAATMTRGSPVLQDLLAQVIAPVLQRS